MGLLVDGVWHDQWHDTGATGGRFVRRESQFRSWVTPDGAPGRTGEGGFRAERSRYHLYVSLACPWAHRTIIFRKLKGLEDAVGMSVVHWLSREHGWTFQPAPGVVPDTVNDAGRPRWPEERARHVEFRCDHAVPVHGRHRQGHLRSQVRSVR